MRAPIDLWTYDVFDTCITRVVAAPDHVHWLVADELINAGLYAGNRLEWRTLRVDAERTTRQTGHPGEIRFEEIYRTIAERLGWDPVRAAAAMECEFAVELRSVTPILTIRDEVVAHHREGRPFLYVSDIYFDASRVTRLLGACGFPTTEGCVVTSADHRATKSRGDLYKAVRAAQRGKARIRHTGDNKVSDVFYAKRNGCKAVHFDGGKPNRYEIAMAQAASEPVIGSLAIGAARASRLAGKQDPISLVATGVAGPLLLSYVGWTLLEARKRGAHNLFYLARDGQILNEIALRIVRAWSLPIQPVYMLGSRRAFHLASMPADAEQAIDLVMRESESGSVDALLSILRLPDTTRSVVLAECSVPATAILSTLSEAEHGAVRASLSMRADDIAAEIAISKREALAYLKQIGFADQNVAHVVDVGWRGRVQLRLARICKDFVDIHGYYIGLLSCPLDISNATSTWSVPDWCQLPLIEILCAADHESIARIGVTPGHFDPLQPDQAALEWGVQHQQNSILEFVDRFLAALPSGTSLEAAIAPLKTAGIAAFSTLRVDPGFPEAQKYGRFLYATDQLHSTMNELAPQPSLWSAVACAVSQKYRNSFTHWYAASLARRVGSAHLPFVGTIYAMAQRRRVQSAFLSVELRHPGA